MHTPPSYYSDVEWSMCPMPGRKFVVYAEATGVTTVYRSSAALISAHSKARRRVKGHGVSVRWADERMKLRPTALMRYFCRAAGLTVRRVDIAWVEVTHPVLAKQKTVTHDHSHHCKKSNAIQSCKVSAAVFGFHGKHSLKVMFRRERKNRREPFGRTS